MNLPVRMRNLPAASAVDFLVGLQSQAGIVNSVQVPITDVATLLASSGPLAARLEAAVDGIHHYLAHVDRATTGNITLSGEQTIDGTLTSASRIGVCYQTDPSKNGIYTTGAGAWTRTADANTTAELYRSAFFVLGGTANQGLTFRCGIAEDAVLGTDPALMVVVDRALNAASFLASPALTGNPTAPTASPGDNDTSIANSAFVTAAVAVEAANRVSSDATLQSSINNAVININASITALQAAYGARLNTLDAQVAALQASTAITSGTVVTHTAQIAALQAADTALGVRVDKMTPGAAGLEEFPGLQPSFFARSSADGDPLAIVPLTSADMIVGTDMPVLRVAGADTIRTRFMFPIRAGRQYKARFAVRRAVNTSDPSGDAVRLAVIWYNKSRTILGGGSATTTLEDLTALTTGSGEVEREFTISKAAGSGIFVPPATAEFGRLYIQTFGTVPSTDIVRMGIRDLTDLVAYSPDVSVFDARVTALETIDAGDRLDVLEATVIAPKTLSFESEAGAVAATIPGSVERLLVYDDGPLLYGLPKHFVRSVGPAAAGKIQTADGAWWLYQGGRRFLNKDILTINAAYTVTSDEYDKVLNLVGTAPGYHFTLSFGAASGYPADFMCTVNNDRDAGTDMTGTKYIAMAGGDSFYLFPGQTILVMNINNKWRVVSRRRFKVPAGDIYVRAAPGAGDASNTLGVGFGSATAPFNGLGFAGYWAQQNIEWNSQSQSRVTISQRDGTIETTNIHWSAYALLGAQGGEAMKFQGEGSNCRIAVTAGSCFENFRSTLYIDNFILSSTVGYGIAGGHQSQTYYKNITLLALPAGGFLTANSAKVEGASPIKIGVSGEPATIGNVAVSTDSSQFYATGVEFQEDATITSWSLESVQGTQKWTGAINLNGKTLASGTKEYSLYYNSFLQGAGGATAYFPGTVAGMFDTTSNAV